MHNHNRKRLPAQPEVRMNIQLFLNTNNIILQIVKLKG